MDVGEAFQKLNNLDVNDLRKIGTAPRSVQLSVVALLAVAIVAGMGWFLVKPALADLEQAEQREQELRSQFEQIQSRAARLSAYKEQLAQMEKSFGAMLRQLPDETDMESLLVDLSQTSVAAGLEVEYFKPGSERKLEFYAEYPIELRVSGTYHEFGKFVSGLAALPRIVTLHDIEIEPSGGDGGNGEGSGAAGSKDLDMTLTAKTYRYLTDEEQASGNGGNQ
jgi:type IV pilus assembly protein PilO